MNNAIRWNVLPAPPQSFLDEHPELPHIVAHLLYHRNIKTKEQIGEFLQTDYSAHVHDPFLFKDMKKAVDRLFDAIKKDEKITIHGDYDADGVSASVILTDTLTALGVKNIDVFLPHRETDGYGLNTNTIDLLAKEGTNVIITCDCGISNALEVARANELGIDVIITDHHTVPEKLPEALAIIHPGVEGETYPSDNLAGGAVAFKLAQALLQTHHKSHDTLDDGSKHEGFEKWLLDMVAIASVADMVPLLGESRTLTKYGLIVLNKARRLGMKKLLIESRLMNDDGTLKQVLDAETIGFRIAPRINAAGRLDHANTAYQLFATKSGAEAVDMAFQLNKSNDERRKLTDEFVKDAIEQIEKGDQLCKEVLFVYSPGWSTGIVGLIASRIKGKYNKPTIAMANKKDEVTGSGRSVPGFDLIESLQEMPQYFTKFGGHPMACGFSLSDPERRDEFQQALCEKYKEKTADLDMTPTLDIDAEVSLDDVDWALYDQLEKFEPFGQQNPKPKYLASNVEIERVSPLGKEGKHIKLMVKHKSNKMRKVVGWQFCTPKSDSENWCETLSPGTKIDMVFELGVNEWNGNRELQLTMIDLRKSEPT